MPLQTEEFVFDDEIERLEAERADLADKVAEIDPSNPATERLAQQGQTLDAHLQGVQWACDEWDVDSVTLGGLTGGEFGQVEDQVVADNADGGSPGPGATRVYLVAKGTIEAPYIDDGMSDNERIAAVAQLPATYLKWAKTRVDDLTSVGNGAGKSFGDLVAAKRQEKEGQN